MEETSAKRLRRNALQNAALSAIASVGVLAIAAAAPNTLKLLKHVPRGWLEGRDPRQRVRETISKLKKKGFIEFTTVGHQKMLRLTRAGEKYAHKITRNATEIPRPRKWDRRWRVIIFDIPERRRNDRHKIRHLLMGLGFYRLQDSVWVHPFECEELIVLLKTDMHLGKHMLYMIVDAIENDGHLKAHFGLAHLP
jgi:hypothetical protein